MGERVGAGADPGAGCGDGDGLEWRLIQCLDFLEFLGISEGYESVASIRAAIDALGEARRAMAGARRLFRDPPKTCECEDCRALRAVDKALARLEGGDGDG